MSFGANAAQTIDISKDNFIPSSLNKETTPSTVYLNHPKINQGDELNLNPVFYEAVNSNWHNATFQQTDNTHYALLDIFLGSQYNKTIFNPRDFYLRIDSQNRFTNDLSNALNWVQKLRLTITDGVLLNDVATFDGTIFGLSTFSVDM